MEQNRAEAKASFDQRAVAKEAEFDTPAVVTISLAHMTHDIYPAFLAPLLPLLIVKLGIPLAAAGVLATIQRSGSLLQPFLGLWADRADCRWFVILAHSGTALAMSLLGVAPDYFSVAFLLAVATISMAAFHPAAAAAVTRASGRSWGRGSSLYMTGGELARAIGPLYIVTIVGWVGLEGSYIAAVPGVLFSFLLYWQLRRRPISLAGSSSVSSIWNAMREQRRPLLLLSGLVLFRAVAVTSFTTFYPTYLVSQGSDLFFAGLVLSVYELAGAGGALVGGTISDRFGRRATMLVSQVATAPLLFMVLMQPPGALGLVLLGLAGALALSAAPVQLTMAMELLPGGRSTASGITFFLGFEGTLVATLAVGFVADLIGLGPALGFSVLASLVSVPFTILLPEPRRGAGGLGSERLASLDRCGPS